MFIKKLKKIIKRHPFLYLTRFRLLSKNSTPEEINNLTYNDLNLRREIPNYFIEINQIIFKNSKPNTDFDIVIQLSVWLKEHIRGGPGLSEPSEKALRTMLSGNGGVCSDMAQVFNNFCVINDIKVREWGTTSSPFNKLYGGHSFNEFFSKEMNKWILIDVYWGFLFYDSDNITLGVIELYQSLRHKKAVNYKSYLNESVTSLTVQKNYLNPTITPFLICDYKSKTYDSILKFTQPYIPIFIVHFMVYISGRSYHYRFPLDNYKDIFAG